MSKFNLEDYETVKERKAKFFKEFNSGSIVVKLKNPETITEYALFEARVFESKEDQKNNTPRGIGYAFEIRDKEMKVSSQGSKYESVNFSSWVENCEESAVGRALDNAGFSGNKKPSREEMMKVERHSQILSKPQPQLDTTLISRCLLHNAPMTQQISKKTNEPYWSHKTADGFLCFGKGIRE